MSDIQDPVPDFSSSGPVEYNPTQTRQHGALAAVLEMEEARLLAMPGVTSVGIGPGPAGGEALVIGVVDAGVAARMPLHIGGVPVVVNVTGPVDALRQG
jgi:tartrate dehydratase alpha subunit/fumarate hydratase class I-like protein